AGKHYDLLTAEKDLLEHTLAGSIKVLVDLLSATQPGCFKEISRMRDWGRLLRNEIAGVNGWELDMAILLSQLGAVLLPPEVSVKWNAGEVLTDTEQTVIEQMPETARDLIMNIPRLEGVANAVYFQDKCFDGSGFPAGEPGGTTIPLTARILNILNGLASASKRGRPGTNAFEALQKAASRYDPSLLATIRGVFERADAIEEEVVLDLPVANMQSGDEVLTDVKSMEGKLLLAAGAILTDAMVKKMRQFHRLSRVEEPISVRRNERSQQAA
ncbi:MAG: HD domain-containing phosphohydrolase, partial [Pseudomonadota bacterium]